MKNLILLFALSLILLNCTENTSNSKVSDLQKDTLSVSNDTIKQQPITDLYPITDSTLIVRFVEFTLGDASHFIFEDEIGIQLDYAGCPSAPFNFAMSLPEEESNESNQGWGSNPKLQGKWFYITFGSRKQELYIDGPMGTVKFIKKVIPYLK